MLTARLRCMFGCLAVIGLAAAGVEAADAFTGRWVAAERDRGVLVTLTIGSENTLVLPGTGPNERTEPLTLKLRNLETAEDRAIFTVDLPLDEGNVDFEFRIHDEGNQGTLRALRVDGEPADDNLPTWKLRRALGDAARSAFSALLTSNVDLMAPRENRRLGVLSLATPEGRGEIVRVVVPIGELTTRLARKISDARYRRAERKAREKVERDLQNFLAHHATR